MVTAVIAGHGGAGSYPGHSERLGRALKAAARLNLWESPMSYVTEAELVEIVPDLRALAGVETSAEVRAALIRLADRYAAMAVESGRPGRARDFESLA
jgi:hypothetical protein